MLERNVGDPYHPYGPSDAEVPDQGIMRSSIAKTQRSAEFVSEVFLLKERSRRWKRVSSQPLLTRVECSASSQPPLRRRSIRSASGALWSSVHIPLLTTRDIRGPLYVSKGSIRRN